MNIGKRKILHESLTQWTLFLLSYPWTREIQVRVMDVYRLTGFVCGRRVRRNGLHVIKTDICVMVL